MSEHNKRISFPPAQTESSSSTRHLSDSNNQYGSMDKKRTVLKDNSWIKHKPEDLSNDENYGKVVLNHYKNGDETDSGPDAPSPEKTNPFLSLKKTPKSNKDQNFVKPIPGQLKSEEGVDRTVTVKTSDSPKVTIFSSDQNGPAKALPSSPVQSKTSVTTRYGPEGDTVITTTTKTSQVKSSTKPGYDRSSSREDVENITNNIKTTTVEDNYKPKSVTTVRTNNITDDDWPDSNWNSTKESTTETRTYITKKTTISEDKPKSVTTIETSSGMDIRKPANEPPKPPKRTSSSTQETSNGGLDFEIQSFPEKSDTGSSKSISDYDYGKQSSYTVKNDTYSPRSSVDYDYGKQSSYTANTDTYSPRSSADYDYDYGGQSSYSVKSSTLPGRSSLDKDYDYGRQSYSVKTSTLPARSSVDYDYDFGRQSSYTVSSDSFSPRNSRSIDSYFDSTDGPNSQTVSYTYETRNSPRISTSYYDSIDGPSSRPVTYTYETKTSSTPSLDLYDMMTSKAMNSVYAGNDRATSEKDFCTYCNKPINQEPKMILEHMNISCHASCFKCGACGAPLGGMVAGDSIWTYKQAVYCERCYNNQKAKWAY
ncbi:sciellin isoform X1 [Protopterus annectens]|uniref:sciellin isoform X1 n=2 Tax=Protopterus annectens TaxID=7888 RepID=UPI001CFBB70C|nr:sciellin isoform X1 [Protopterus annectens]